MIITPLFVVFLVVVFILVWLFINTIDKRKWLTFLISLVLAPIVYFYLFYPMLNIFSSYHHQKYFNTEAWKEKPALRYEMIGNIVDESLFTGKTKSEVEMLLGKSEWFGWDDSIKANSPEKWNYNLGIKPGAFNKMQECVEFSFSNNRVNTIKQYQLKQKFE
ncbi:hypothetical protein MBM09_07145 [Flaviramulus sp. BrNp1-15]|uniref:hypothetical protein n=1 Tax=Flaviramulus sp. BrNp1-15 TaxID=2916754 RepID=UPI001EE8E7D3|nr:hypothetical protein [Flaviramulus sp. BrNp1-15]ULC60765.1 hypothetical protein MBM09_07145 [Flaviramulus sp. BrNp1-15]